MVLDHRDDCVAILAFMLQKPKPFQSPAAVTFGPGSAAKEREPSNWKWEKLEMERQLRDLRKKLEDVQSDAKKPTASPAIKDAPGSGGKDDLQKTKQLLVEKEAELVDKTKNIKDLLDRLKVKETEVKNARAEKERHEEKVRELSRRVESLEEERQRTLAQSKEAREKLERELAAAKISGHIGRMSGTGEPVNVAPGNAESSRLADEIARLKAELADTSRKCNIEKYDLQKKINEKVKVIDENKITMNWLRGEIDKLKLQVGIHVGVNV